MLEIMDRRSDWAAIIALIGGGQEINSGEAGLAEWGRALTNRFCHWQAVIAREMSSGTTISGSTLFPDGTLGVNVIEEPALHLRVNLRSYKAQALSDFVDAVLALDAARARSIFANLTDFPLVLTRELHKARQWLRKRARGSRRVGLIASSGARRIKAHGLDVRTKLDVTNWFLNPAVDVRSSSFLEVPATEFGIQGLELDWAGLCWGGDLTVKDRTWFFQSFKGTKWGDVSNEIRRQYIINKYRVLMTRSRGSGDLGTTRRPI